MDTKRKLGKLYLYQKKKDFKTKIEVRDKEEHCIRIKESIQQEDIKLINIYGPNIGVVTKLKDT